VLKYAICSDILSSCFAVEILARFMRYIPIFSLNYGTSHCRGIIKDSSADPAFLTFSEKTPGLFQNRDASTEGVQGRHTKTTTICPRQGDAMAITGSSFGRAPQRVPNSPVLVSRPIAIESAQRLMTRRPRITAILVSFETPH
jgi:hypothetical protein